jgi:hypothetical protein
MGINAFKEPFWGIKTTTHLPLPSGERIKVRGIEKNLKREKGEGRKAEKSKYWTQINTDF